MESRAPAVVAVVVTTGPGPGLEATLASLADQDYPELSLLVVANGDADQVSARVAAVAPHAFVRVLEENRGFGAACNEAALMVEGSAFFLFCHDDVRLDSDAVHLMVEAAFRANAGVVTPKVVAYDDPLVLLHVGQTCDRFGVVQERIQRGEIDHGQQDLERDVFVAPGGVTLVRADLFATLRGFDPMITVLGEDLDLCWRAQVAGARVIVAPSAKVAHRETIATGERPVTVVGTRRASRQDLQRRHQLLVVGTGWGRRYSLVTLAALAVMDLMEVAVALVGRDTDRAGAIAGSWRWLFTHRRRIAERRRQRHQTRVLADADLHRLQVGGAHRLKRFVVLLAREGLDRARGILPEAEAEPEPRVDEGVDAGAGFGAAFAESEGFDDIPEGELLGRRRGARFLTSFRSQATAILTVTVLWAIGGRNLVAMHLPLVGRLAPLDSWWTSWRHFFASWSPNGVGTGAPGMPGYGLLAFAGTFVFGRMGILPRLALLLAAPLGAVGVARLLKGRVSNRARVVASVAYLALPVGMNMIAQGRLDVLAVVAGLPFVARRLFELLGVPGFPATPFAHPVPFGRRGWRATRTGQRVVAVILIALVSAMAPATLVAVALVVAGVTLVRAVERDESDPPGQPLRVFGVVIGGVAVLLAPLTLDVLLAGRSALGVFGAARGPWSTPGFDLLVRGVDGTFGTSWSGYLLPGAALCSLAVCRGDRRRVATKVATIAVLTLVVTSLVARHWTGAFTPDLDVLLALYVTCLAALIGLGVSAVELDLRRVSFGWRQALAGVVVVTLAVAAVPFVANLSSGRFDLPTTSVAESLSALAPADTGGYRVLWLADPSVEPLAGWSVVPGLAAATSVNGLPGGATLFTAPGAGAAVGILRDVRLALEGRTVRLGQLLASAGVSSIVVMNSAAPEVADVQRVPLRPVPTTLVEALNRQVDLSLELQTRSVEVFADSLFHGVVAQGTAAGGLTPVLGPPGTVGTLTPGEDVVAGLAPASAFALDVNGAAAPSVAVPGDWAATYQVAATSAAPTGRVVLRRFPWNGLLAGLTLVAWLYAATGFGGRRIDRLVSPREVSTGRHVRRDDA
ncbi:MAG: glycosyltransferase [Acidimicrobiales bacterium]